MNSNDPAEVVRESILQGLETLFKITSSEHAISFMFCTLVGGFEKFQKNANLSPTQASSAIMNHTYQHLAESSEREQIQELIDQFILHIGMASQNIRCTRV